MDPIISLLLGLVIGVVLGGVIGLLVARSRPASSQPLDVVAELKAEAAAADATAVALREQVEQLLGQQRVNQQRHENDSRVLQALSPVQETLRTMQQTVAELEAQRSLQHGQLSEQLKNATESEERLRGTAESLASALRNNGTRGVWGETQLRNVVQAAGLIERVDFDVQSSISSDAGAGRPDMVIHLPGGKNIAVDAKVPFAAYLEASQIAVTATGEEGARREALMKQHVRVVRNHIDTLASKAYWAGLDASPELVIAFIPSESLVASAMEADPSIMDYAFGKRVALASPVTLWSVLKTVAFTWQQDVLTENAKNLFDLGKELYQRLSLLSEHADKLRRSIDSTVTNYNAFANSLESRVLVTARKLNVLDESKVIGTAATTESSARPLTALEFDLPSAS
ncbi:DNA recombination protein RmuC [Conyzicola lurida]|uniref:DNA recombination protein RmuC n=1 Tax=Conyzicola lurida TaxID=1172621 RepID=A0A841AL30_9MICO|nr:DNA recombination protein RmuC [Conyzicola lurida]MBB5842353.1 DNA recombination protein RmuC [Conyzicola lurida]